MAATTNPANAQRAKLTKIIGRFDRIGIDGAVLTLALIVAAHSWAIYGVGFYVLLAIIGLTTGFCLIGAAWMRVVRWNGYLKGFAPLVPAIIQVIAALAVMKYAMVYLVYVLTH